MEPVNLIHLEQLKQNLLLTEIELYILNCAIWEIEESRGMHVVKEVIEPPKPHRLDLTKPRMVSKQEAAYYRAKGYTIEYQPEGFDWMVMYSSSWKSKALYRVISFVE